MSEYQSIGKELDEILLIRSDHVTRLNTGIHRTNGKCLQKKKYGIKVGYVYSQNTETRNTILTIKN